MTTQDMTMLVGEAEQLLREVESAQPEQASDALLGFCERLQWTLVRIDRHLEKSQAEVESGNGMRDRVAHMQERLDHLLSEAKLRLDVPPARPGAGAV